jgi:NTP pyrophosphatase (non-canonical NTP hydrolase)
MLMDFNDYQKLAQQTAIYTDPMYLVTSLMIEAAEAADLFVKLLLRGDDVEIDKVKVVSELGDVLWNLANMAADQGLKLEDIAIFNVEKLKSRQARGVIQGSGGDR